MPSGAVGRAVGWVLVLGAVIACEAWGQETSARTLYHRSRSFRIPVTIAEEARDQVRDVRLWVSDDLGYSWKDYARTTPQRPEFPFKAPRDGEYWFAVQTLDRQGRVYPADDRTVEPSMKVVVDTVPPVLVLEPRGRRGSELAILWEMKDSHLVPGSLVLEYQAEGARENEWRAVPLRSDELVASGSKAWDAGTADAIRVRGTVKDRAGNTRTVELTIGDGLAASPGFAGFERDGAPPPITPISRSRSVEEEDPFAPQTGMGQAGLSGGREAPSGGGDALMGGFEEEVSAPPAAPGDATSASRISAATDAPTMLVGSQSFSLKYAVDDAGPSGPALVEMWVTRDGGRTWSRQPPDADRMSPYPLDLGGEGTFGLWLVVQGSSGLGDPPPAPGDRPQLWVEVDSSPPVVLLDTPRVGNGQALGKVLITWRATDAHLGERPVMLSYRADAPDASWQPITERIPNSGRYIWEVPAGAPGRFHLRVEVADTLGHKAVAEATDLGPPIIVDRSRPRGRILGLEDSAQFGAQERSRQ